MTQQRGRRDFLGAGDPGFFDDLFRRFIDDPHSVPQDVAKEFALFLAEFVPADADKAAFWRTNGHRFASLDPLSGPLDREPKGVDHPLSEAYSGSIGWDFMHVEDATRREWIAMQAENLPQSLTAAEQDSILDILTQAEDFERAMQTRFPTEKRFGLEGAESYLVLCETIVRQSVRRGVENVVIGGMHRGRLNILAHLMKKPLREIIAELTGQAPQAFDGLAFASDVAYHNGYSSDRLIDGRSVHLSILPHPSHLSIIAPVALGKARGLLDRLGNQASSGVLPVLMHTDAAFAGQGVISETLQLSGLPAYSAGGGIHLVLNNNIGFTTNPEEGRSTRYCTDIARAYGIPVIHVNGDDPEAVFRTAIIAAEYRYKFKGDIVVDLQAYRRRGHNELDEPRFTQPALYKNVDATESVATLYRRRLAASETGGIPPHRPDDYINYMTGEAKAAASGVSNAAKGFFEHWNGLHRGAEKDIAAFTPTGVTIDVLRRLGQSLTALPDGFAVDPKVARFLDERRASIDHGRGVTWATAEALAFASLAEEGFSVRLSGQDTVRGAFAHRHLVLHDQNDGRRRHVLPPTQDGRGEIDIFNTPLTECSVLAFEYGYSLATPRTLVCWEAQFGDFLNIAQSVMDQFISCGEERWLRSSGLVLLLPHGLDGGGPDHSTAHPERLLNACANGNMEVINASTPAQYFHLLRRQMHRPFRKPLALLAPKTLLRYRACVSDFEEFGPGTGFRNILPEPTATAHRVILCSGKIYFELSEERGRQNLQGHVAIVRLEQLYPLDVEGLKTVLARYPGAELVWCQEEPANMGAFCVIERLLESAAGRAVRYVGRPPAASPAVGSHAWHEQERRGVLEDALTF